MFGQSYQNQRSKLNNNFNYFVSNRTLFSGIGHLYMNKKSHPEKWSI